MGVMTQFESVKRGETGGQGIGEGVIEVGGRDREMGGGHSWGPWLTSETDAVKSESRRGQGRTVFLDSP